MNTTIASLKGAEAKGLRAITVGGFLLASLGVCAAEEAKQEQVNKEKPAKTEAVTGELDATTIIANRSETDLSKVGSSVTVLDTKKLQDQGVRFFADALKYSPGVISDTSSGQRGTTSSIYIRGNESKYTGMMVDGIRMGGTSFEQGNFIGTSNLLGMSKIEVLKGPQGVVYGASAMAGVVGVSNQKGSGNPSSELKVEGGSFNSWNKVFNTQGESGAFSYSLSIGHEKTDNDLPNNKFEAFSSAIRLDYAVNDSFRLGMTFRSIDSTAQLPQYKKPYPDDKDVNFDYTLSTFFAEYDVNDVWSSKLTLGYYDENYNTVDAASQVKTYNVDSNKFATYWDNTLTWNDQFTTVVGLAFEQSEYENQSKTAWSSSELPTTQRDQFAMYLNQIWNVTDNWSITGGLRWEDYSDDAENGFNGDVTTWRVATAYTVSQTNSILRASVGTGFQLPTFYEVYANSFQHKDPNLVNDLDPAKSIGWDIGIEQPFYDGQYTVGVTYFATRVEDAIEWQANPLWAPVYANRDGITETSGIEAFAKANFLDDRLTTTLAYTWLDRQTLSEPHFLPENVLSLRVDGQVTAQLNLGITATYTDDRALYGDVLDDYALVNIYANYVLNDHVKLSARVDNLFDKEFYYGASQYGVQPGRGVGFFGGVTVTF